MCALKFGDRSVSLGNTTLAFVDLHSKDRFLSFLSASVLFCVGGGGGQESSLQREGSIFCQASPCYE